MTLNWGKDQEYVSLISDLLLLDTLQKLEQYQHHYVTNRLAHSISVSYRSYRWAKRFKLNYESVARAALLHDLFFYESKDKGSVGGKGHNYEHPRIALRNAQEIMNLTDLEQDIILKHMFGATFDLPKYAESWIVTLMDKESAVCEIVSAVISFTSMFAVSKSKLIYQKLEPILFYNMDQWNW